MRWNFGLPQFLKHRRLLLFLLILIDIALTPFLLPVIGFAFHMDQKRVSNIVVYKGNSLIFLADIRSGPRVHGSGAP